MFKGGYSNRILRLNLNEQKAYVESIPYKLAEKYIGGVGFGVKYLYDELPANVDPLSPENKVVFSAGPLTGTSTPCASRMSVCSKSPLTNAFGASFSGGYFPAEMKFAGYDSIIIEGRAKRPTYIYINDEKVIFKNAKRIWGLNTFDTQKILKDEIKDQNAKVACIGPAGENLCRIACIINESRAAGRKGLGAVMGSKNLKAISIRGTGKINIASESKFRTARKKMIDELKNSPSLFNVFSKIGTSGTLVATTSLGIFPAKNWTATGEFNPIDKIGITTQEKLKVGKSHCFGCPIACSQLLLCRKGNYAGILSEGPEYETQYSYGGQTGVDNLESIIAADRLSDELGLDTISTGVVIGFAMELYEKNILKKCDTNGLDLKFGNYREMLEIVRMIAFREGIGNILAEGVLRAAEKIGSGAEKYAMHVKGLELPAYDVRGAKSQGLNYATAYTGADHNRGYACQEIFGAEYPATYDRFKITGKAELTKWNQDMQTGIADCPTVCAFPILMALLENGPRIISNLINAVTGMNLKSNDLMQVGERVINLAKLFNLREGFGRIDDKLPKRLTDEFIIAGPSKGHRISEEELKIMIEEYYLARGWDPETGIPTPEKLQELGI